MSIIIRIIRIIIIIIIIWREWSTKELNETFDARSTGLSKGIDGIIRKDEAEGRAAREGAEMVGVGVGELEAEVGLDQRAWADDVPVAESEILGDQREVEALAVHQRGRHGTEGIGAGGIDGRHGFLESVIEFVKINKKSW